MKRTLVRLLLFLLAAVGGLLTAELLRHLPWSRELTARYLGAVSDGRVERNLRAASLREAVADAAIERELELLRHQFGDEERFAQALVASGITADELRAQIAEHLRALSWIEKEIAPHARVNDAEIRAYYAQHRGSFAQPQCYRASHLFLAAPAAAPPDTVTAKQRAIEALSMRLLGGEKFAQLVAAASEDEASKARGGDLSYFTEARIPSEFIDELKKLRVGETSGPVRSPVGFHLVQLTEVKPARELSLEQARAEITAAIGNQKRALALASLTERLSTPEFEPR